MVRELRPALMVFLVLTVITGVLYPGVVTLAGRVLFRAASVGECDRARWAAQSARAFWGSPSRAHGISGGARPRPRRSPTTARCRAARTRARPIPRWKKRCASGSRRYVPPIRATCAPVPVDLVTASGSGLDPHISPAAAEYQVARVARARGWMRRRCASWCKMPLEGRTFGVLGEPRVNVLGLNLALDAVTDAKP